MKAAPVLSAAAAGAGRRWVQTSVMFVVVGVTAASAVLGLTLATTSGASFQTALAKRKAPDLAVEINATKVTAAELARTRHLRGVSTTAGPYPETTIPLAAAAGSRSVSSPLRVVGRSSSKGPLDDLTCFTSPPGISSCGWPTRPGEIEISSFAPVQIAPSGGRLGPVGEKVKVTSMHTRPTLTVVGYAVSISNDADAWAVPAEITALQHAGAPRLEQMLYDFASAFTRGQLNADLAKFKAALPAGAITGTADLLGVRYQNQAGASQKPPLVEPFALIVLLLAMLITGIVVTAAVSASYRRIGVLKSIGFTPAQLVATYLLQLAVPALAGAIAGTAIGDSWAAPEINGGPYHIHIGVPQSITLTTPAGVLALAALLVGIASALGPAIWAARYLPTTTLQAE